MKEVAVLDVGTAAAKGGGGKGGGGGGKAAFANDKREKALARFFARCREVIMRSI